MVFGLTGGIGSGKSRVAAKLSEVCRLPLLDVDQIAKAHLTINSSTLELLRAEIGSQYFLANGNLDRVSLRKDIFEDIGLRHRVDDLLHPIIQSSLKIEIGQLLKNGVKDILVEVPLLYEAGWQNFFAKIIVVYADYLTCAERIVKRDGVTFSEAELAINSQDDLAEKVLKCDYVIDNSGPWSDTVLQIVRLSEILGQKS